MIKDSGERREFSTGAVRDIQEGKGRCDLMPIEIMADDSIVMSIGRYKETKDASWLTFTVDKFIKENYESKWDALLDVSKHYEEGALKYGENNWQKGIPAHSFLDSALRHYLKFKRGDTDEPHDRAFLWNMYSLIWTLKNKPELDDIGGQND